MPILELQQRLREIGRIRLGYSTPNADPKKRDIPHKSDHLILTSSDRTALEHAAQLYGGKVKPWDKTPGQFTLTIEATELPVIVSPIPVDQWLEQWSAGGCSHRCDGCTNTITDEPCSCDRDNPTDPKAHPCKPVTRVSLMLPEIQGLGVWRLESKGYYAASELPTSVDLLREGAKRGAHIPATLAIEQRTVVRNGTTKKFPVPVLRLRMALSNMLSIQGQERPALHVATQSDTRAMEAPRQSLPSPQESDYKVKEETLLDHRLKEETEAAASILRQNGWTKAEFKGQVDAIKATCKEKGHRFSFVLLEAVEDHGCTDLESIGLYASGLKAVEVVA